MKGEEPRADWKQVQMYVTRRLSADLPPDLYYHNLAHTLDDVLPAAERLAAIASLSSEDTLLLRTAALYHDLGYLVRYHENEIIATSIATETLPRFGYTPIQIDRINAMILATHMPQSPHSQLEALLCDADLDSLGREDFFEVNRRLHKEIMAHENPVSQEIWAAEQLKFLTQHSYFTAAAHALRDAGKQWNIQLLSEQLIRFHQGHIADGLPRSAVAKPIV